MRGEAASPTLDAAAEPAVSEESASALHACCWSASCLCAPPQCPAPAFSSSCGIVLLLPSPSHVSALVCHCSFRLAPLSVPQLNCCVRCCAGCKLLADVGHTGPRVQTSRVLNKRTWLTDITYDVLGDVLQRAWMVFILLAPLLTLRQGCIELRQSFAVKIASRLERGSPGAARNFEQPLCEDAIWRTLQRLSSKSGAATACRIHVEHVQEASGAMLQRLPPPPPLEKMLQMCTAHILVLVFALRGAATPPTLGRRRTAAPTAAAPPRCRRCPRRWGTASRSGLSWVQARRSARCCAVPP